MEQNKFMTWAEFASWLYEDRFDCSSCYDFYKVSTDGLTIKPMECYTLSWQQIGDSRLLILRQERTGEMLSLLLTSDMTLTTLKEKLYFYFVETNFSQYVSVDAESHRKAFALTADPSCLRDDIEDSYVYIPVNDFAQFVAEHIFTEGRIDFGSSYMRDWHQIVAVTIPRAYNCRYGGAKLVFCSRWDGKLELFSYDATDEILKDNLVNELLEFFRSQQVVGEVLVMPALGTKILNGGDDTKTLDQEKFIQWLKANYAIGDQAIALIDNILYYAAGFKDRSDQFEFLKDMLCNIKGVHIPNEIIAQIYLD